ncbi:MAG: carboxypeptidase-like regulatory domain-containing protein [Chitinophagaceae bacterium]|nr:carboxypeptidase-like regulatory domain-containing protein [Chitinophagaceae bacterium]
MIVRSIFLSVLLLAAVSHHAQIILTGVVLDSASREPLAGASVFCRNTTQGTTTDKNGNFSLTLKPGGYDLVISYTGFQTQLFRITESKHLEILMIQEEKSMGEVVVRNTNEVKDGFTKYGEFFLAHFIGSTPNARQCILRNPDVLKFYFFKRSNRLKVTATAPLIIDNYALGYHLQYQLDSFVYHYNTDISSYRGYCLFSEMQGSDSLKNVWALARKKAYFGSLLHFMRSYYDSALVQEGWMIEMQDEASPAKFNRVADVYDTAHYNVIVSENQAGDSSAVKTTEVEIYFPRKISITYKGAAPEKEYLKKMNYPMNVPYQISFAEMKDWITITENGYYYNPAQWMNEGYWSWKNLADQLPYDYWPD